MPLVLPNLQRDIRKALKAAQGAKSAAEGERIFSQQLAIAIDKYIKMGIVQVNTDTPLITILPGQRTQWGTTITPGKPVPASTRGTGIGKVI